MTNYRFSIILTLLVSALGLEAQVISHRPTVNAEYDRTRDFSVFTTYDWMKSQKPAPNMANHIRFTRAVQKEMEDLGISIDTVKPSLRVLYRVNTHRKVEAAGSQQRDSASDPTKTNITTGFVFGTGTSENMGTLIIELYDGETNVLVWKGTTTQAIGTPDKAEQIINDVVERVFTKYPTKEQKE